MARKYYILLAAALGGFAAWAAIFTALWADTATVLNSISTNGTNSEYYPKIRGLVLSYYDKEITNFDQRNLQFLVQEMSFGGALATDFAGGYAVRARFILSNGHPVPFRIVYNKENRNVLTFEIDRAAGRLFPLGDTFKDRIVRISDEQLHEYSLFDMLDSIVKR